MKVFVFILLFSPMFALGQYCQDEAQIAAKLKQTENDELTCLDSREDNAAGKMITRYVFHKQVFDDEYVVVYTLTDDISSNVETFRLNEVNNPRKCGDGLMGVRLLTGTSQLLFIYAFGVLRTVDLQGRVTWIYDTRPKDGMYSCGGYAVSAEAERKNIQVEDGLIKAKLLDQTRTVRVCEKKEDQYDLSNKQHVESLKFQLGIYKGLQQKRGPGANLDLDDTVAALEISLKTGVLVLQECSNRFPRVYKEFNIAEILGGR